MVANAISKTETLQISLILNDAMEHITQLNLTGPLKLLQYSAFQSYRMFPFSGVYTDRLTE